MKNWIELSAERKKEIFTQAAEKLNLTTESVEKDFWVVVVLRAIFSMKISCQYVSNEFKSMLQEQLTTMGFSGEQLKVIAEETEAGTTDRDPQRLFVSYDSIVSRSGYLKENVVVEVGSRSQLEPSEKRELNSLLAEAFPEGSFIQSPLALTAISPKRTFLEKLILLHEEFTKPHDQIRNERMSRHLYDIERLMDTEYGVDAIKDTELMKSIIAHRKLFTPIKEVDYDSLDLKKLSFIPPDDLLSIWEKDYNTMRGEMFYGESLEFPKILSRLKELSDRIKS